MEKTASRPRISLLRAFMSFFRRYADFKGRSRRSEFWWMWLILVVVGNMVSTTYATSFGNMLFDAPYPSLANAFRHMDATSIVVFVLLAAYTLGMITPTLALSVRRLHDVGLSGFWLFLFIIPMAGGLALFVMFLMDSKPKANKWGSSPKYAPAGSEEELRRS